jgi:hypothetical protein
MPLFQGPYFMNRGYSYFTRAPFFVQLQQGSLLFSPYSPSYTWVQHGSLPFFPPPFSFFFSSPTPRPTLHPIVLSHAPLPFPPPPSPIARARALPSPADLAVTRSYPLPALTQRSGGARVGWRCARPCPTRWGDDYDCGGARAPAAPPLLPGLQAARICTCSISGGPSSSFWPLGLL